MAKPAFTIELETAKFNRFISRFIRESGMDVNVVLKKFAFDLLGMIVGNTSGYRHPV